jgi:hypothetical protein
MSRVDSWSVVRAGFRDNWRPTLLYFVAPALLFPTVLVGGAAAYLAWRPSQAPIVPDSAGIPASERTNTLVQLFHCLRLGPDECSDFTVTLDYLDRITESAFVYTPLHPGDPGDPIGDGALRVRLGQLQPAGALAVGAAVTRDGAVTTLPPDLTSTTVGDRELVRFTAGTAQATVTFMLRSESFRLLSITYSTEGGR